jgi:predicted enzyme related to lactoylglutathione lyase
MKLAYGIFYTNDLRAISKYYTDVLGFEIAFGDDTFIAFKVGDALLGIQRKLIDREMPGHQTAIILVDNVDEWYKELKEKGVIIFSEITNAEWGRNFSILDPDGNRIEFFTRNL